VAEFSLHIDVGSFTLLLQLDWVQGTRGLGGIFGGGLGRNRW